MRRPLSRFIATFVLIAATVTGAQAANDDAPKHIFYIMMENHGYSAIIGNTADAPFINQLAAKANVATQYYGVTHPSLPNYLAAVSGDFQGIWDDCPAGITSRCAPEEFIPTSGDGTAGTYLTSNEFANASLTPHLFSGGNIVDQLEQEGLSWKVYEEYLPAAGDITTVNAPVIGGVQTQQYAQKHNPFVYFSDIATNPQRLAKIVPYEDPSQGFLADLSRKDVPNFTFIVPGQCHDMHGVSAARAAALGVPACGYPDSGLDHGAIQLGDAWLQGAVTAIRSSWAWKHERSSIIIVWDEDDYTGFSGCCGSPKGVDGITLGGSQVAAIVVNNQGPSGIRLPVKGNHYTMLGAIETLWRLNCLGATCNLYNRVAMLPLFF